MKLYALALLSILHTQSAVAQIEPATLVTVRSGCVDRNCNGRHALVFVHGIYGGSETFLNASVSPTFSWPNHVPISVGGTPIDVYRIDYKTAMLSWAKQDIASLDQVVESLYPKLAGLRRSHYDSVNFIAHSLGGNVVAAYLQSVKSEEGHVERSRHGFVLTLGTPVGGAAIANVGLLLKSVLGMNDPLLSSLQRDNTFLRMMTLWARQADVKSTNFHCRPVHLYAAIETKALGPMQIVDTASARDSLPDFARFKEFPLNHAEIARPSSESDALFQWSQDILKTEIERINSWKIDLCERLF